MRIGLKEGAVEDAIARLFQIDISKVQWVNMLIGDIGETPLLARLGRLDEAQQYKSCPFCKKSTDALFLPTCTS